MALQLLRRAERFPNGRIKGAAPPVLVPKVIRRLSAADLAKVQGVRLEQLEVRRKMLVLLHSLGLDPSRSYEFKPSGEVIEVGRYSPRY